MREILFRGKRKDNGEWLYGNYCVAEYLTNNGIEHLIIETPRSGCSAHIIPETVGQFTGLTDKNGTKIFEGDILKHYCERKVDGEISIGFVFWDEKHCLYLRTSSIGISPPRISANCEYEVIGNIHDNPELLSGKEGDL